MNGTEIMLGLHQDSVIHNGVPIIPNTDRAAGAQNLSGWLSIASPPPANIMTKQSTATRFGEVRSLTTNTLSDDERLHPAFAEASAGGDFGGLLSCRFALARRQPGSESGMWRAPV